MSGQNNFLVGHAEVRGHNGMTIIPNPSTVSSFKVRGQVPGGINYVGTS